MSKKFFQRFIAILIILLATLIHIPSAFKDVGLILLAVLLIISTFEFRKS